MLTRGAESKQPAVPLPRQRLHHGFTLIELAVLMVVMGILAGIIIPQVLAATRRANESALRADLQTLRVAIERFHADCGGYPPRLNDILVWNGDHVSAAVEGGGHDLDLESYRGPYMRTGDMLLPCDPLTDLRDWQYDSATGAVHSNNSRVASDGTFYSTW